MSLFFHNYSSTSEGKKRDIRPIKTNLSPNMTFEKLTKYINESPLYAGQRFNKDYREIYFIDDSYEITLTIIQNENGSSIINVNVFKDKKFCLTKGKLKQIVNDFTELLAR